jgi:hypothetical protein
MKRYYYLLMAVLVGMGCLFPFACAYVGPQYPTNYGGPTPTPYPNVSVTVVGPCPGLTPGPGCFSINPAAVTISAGGSVTFYDNSGTNHTLQPDNGTGTNCGSTTYLLLAGSSVVIPFANVDTYHVSDVTYTLCTNKASCLNCNQGMNETVYSDP